MVRPDVVLHRILTARERLREAESIFAEISDDLLADASRRPRDLGMFYLFLAIQECIDIAAHWVADAGWGAPQGAGETFDKLHRHGVIDAEHAGLLRGCVGLRNRIGHGYTSIDPERVQVEFSAGVDALRRFLDLAAEAAEQETAS